MIIDALQHIKSGVGNCATACYRALLPQGVEPSPLHDFMLEEYADHLEHIAACAALEIYRETGTLGGIFPMPDTEKPSEYFNHSMDNTPKASDGGAGLFFGALIRRCFEKEDGQRIGHVIAVTSSDPQNNQYEVLDRTPVEYQESYYSVPVEGLDTLVTQQFVGKLVRVLILAGITPDNPLFRLEEYQAAMKRSVAKWTAWEESFVSAFQASRDKNG